MKKFLKTGVIFIVAAMILALSACDESTPDVNTSLSASNSLSDTSEINSDTSSEAEISFTASDLNSNEVSSIPTPDVKPESASSEPTSVEIPYDVVEVSDESEKNDIIEFLKQTYGEKADETGFLMTYGINGTVNYNGAQYYLASIRWLVEDDAGNITHSSRLGEVLVSMDKTEVYNAFIEGDTITVYR